MKKRRKERRTSLKKIITAPPHNFSMEIIILILIIFIICEIFWTEVVNYRENQIEEKVKELKILIETKDKSYN